MNKTLIIIKWKHRIESLACTGSDGIKNINDNTSNTLFIYFLIKMSITRTKSSLSTGFYCHIAGFYLLKSPY